MVKDVNNHLKTRCAICWQLLRPKSPLLHGTKCNRYEIREKLKFLLPPQDFRTLFDENIFSNPRLCNLCFVTIRKIPKAITKVQNLFGKSINIKLYKPHRIEWKEDFRDVDSFSAKKYKSSAKDIKKTKSPLQQTVNSLKTFKSDSKDVLLYTHTERQGEQFKEINKIEASNLLGPLNSHNTEDAIDECTDSFLFNSTLETTDKVLSDIITPKEEQLSGESGITIRSAEVAYLPLSSLAQFDTQEIESEKKKSDHCLSDVKVRERRKNKRTKDSFLGHKLQPLRESKRIATIKSQNRKKCSEVKENSDLEFVSDVTISDSEDEYIPPSVKLFRREPENETNKYCKFSERTGSSKSIKKLMLRSKKSSATVVTKSNLLVSETVENQLSGNESIYEIRFNGGETDFKTDIPTDLSEFSKSRLRELAAKVKKTFGLKKKKLQKIFIKCSMGNCNHFYPDWSHMAVHFKYYHFNGQPSPGVDEFIEKLCRFADWKELDRNLYPFKCHHRGCDLAFSKEDFLKEHKLNHGTDMVYICDFPDCSKAFKMPRFLHAHFKSHTEGRQLVCKPLGCNKTFPIVSEINSSVSTHTKVENYDCDLCGKKFSNDLGLAGHKRKIHGVGKSGQHKCPYEGCSESFVKKEKLEIHLCSHSPERQLFCEKCGKKFSCQRYLDVHYKIHIKNEKHATQPPTRNIPCEFPGCKKMFTTGENMKKSYTNQHRGRKLPKSVPGVFYSCPVEGLWPRNLLSLDPLYTNINKLVHQNWRITSRIKRIVTYSCTYALMLSPV
ncbi:hypothetical protein Btru_002620 [Bulinus truncatus]|nr:hypothetical protein Btru_002620 [Bulinus truncatus]